VEFFRFDKLDQLSFVHRGVNSVMMCFLGLFICFIAVSLGALNFYSKFFTITIN
jgi:hypothetical protein